MCWRKQGLLALCLVVLHVATAQDKNDFPYQLSGRDWAIAPVAAASYFYGSYLGDQRDHNLSLQAIQALKSSAVPAWDRVAIHNHNRSADKLSDVLQLGMPMAATMVAAPLALRGEWKNTITLGVMYAEVWMLTKGITDMTKAWVGRIRPYLYNTDLSAEQRFAMQGHDAPLGSTSFFSGHTSTVFAFAVLASRTFQDLYGKGTWSTVVWSGSLSLATLTAWGRVAAGEHFPTDVIAGAVVGSAIGYFIPVLHRHNTGKLAWSVSPGYLSLTYAL